MILKYELVRIRKEKQCLLKYLGILLKGLSKITKKIVIRSAFRPVI